MENTATDVGATAEPEVRRVLVVDDEPDIVRLLQFNLERRGYTVDTAYNGVEALKRVYQNAYDLVVCDIMMPEMDGFELLSHVRRDPTLKDLPFLLLTAKDQEADIITGYGKGADLYITKPIDPVELLRLIDRLQGKD